MDRVVKQFLQAENPQNNLLENYLSDRLGTVKHLAQSFASEAKVLDSIAKLDVSRGINLNEELRRYEITLIRQALFLSDWNQKRAAQLLGILPTTLHEKIRRYGISIP